jgi:glycosyltransferase involved in cell wall biosynthesis
MKIFLHGGSLTERGTTRALLDYAKYLREFYSHDVTLVFPKSKVDFEKYKKIIDLISEDHQTIYYKNNIELEKDIKREGVDFFYSIKGGDYDGLGFKDTRNLVHSVFQVFQPHGHRYAYNSIWISNKMRSRFNNHKFRSFFGSSIYGRIISEKIWNTNFSKMVSDYLVCENKFSFDYVPHIVEMPTNSGNLRQSLGISNEAFIIGAMAGEGQFNLNFVKSAIESFLETHSNAYFIGVNIDKFSTSKNAIFLKPIYNQEHKVEFLSSLDLFINAREMGESFGLAICESLFQGIPVLAWNGGSDLNHVELLSGKDWLYKDYNSLIRKLEYFYKSKFEEEDFSEDAKSIVAQFQPKNVMLKFNKVFLE